MKIKNIYSIILIILLILGIQLILAQEDAINDIRNCYTDSIESSLILLSMQGGRIDNELLLSEDLETEYTPIEIDNEFIQIYHAYEPNKNKLLSKEQLAQEIKNSVDKLLFNCLQNYDFESKDYKSTYDYPRTQVLINQESISFTTELNLKVSDSNDNTEELKTLNKVINLRLEYIYDAMNNIINQYIQDPSKINKDSIVIYDSLSLNIIGNIPNRKDVIIFSIVDEKSIISGTNIPFMFAIKTKIEEIDFPPEPPVEECIQIDKQYSTKDPDAKCCEGLKPTTNFKCPFGAKCSFDHSQRICSKIGDGKCGVGENLRKSPEDC